MKLDGARPRMADGECDLPQPDRKRDAGGGGAGTATRIHAALLQAIREGRYAPGSKLPDERQLADRMKASRQQVRDALLLLSEAGLITRRVGSGTWLSDNAPTLIARMDAAADLSSVRDVSLAKAIEARLVIEPGAARLAARNAAPAQVVELGRALEAIRGPVTWHGFVSLTNAFIRSVYVASNNGILLSTFDRMQGMRLPDRGNDGATAGAVSEIVRRHAYEQLSRIYRAIADGDEARAEAVTRNYLVALAASFSLA